MIGYLAVRSLIALTGSYEVGSRIQVLFWLGFALWLIGLGLFTVVRAALRLPLARRQRRQRY